MTFRCPRAGLGLAVGLALLLPAGGVSGQAPAGPGVAGPAGRVMTPPPLPAATVSPVEFFLELLAASAARRDQILEGKSPAAREVILRRIAEFERMEPEARVEAEWQLRLAQFRFYLSPLLSLPPDQRAARLALAPAKDRPLLEERLKAWDGMDEAARRQVLESQGRFHHFVAQPVADPGRLARVLATAPVPARAGIEAEFRLWSALPEAERRQRSAAFQALFDLPVEGRSRALKALSEPERRGMQRTLERFAQLPPEERGRCIDGLERLARMSPAERDAFLRNAELWQRMSSSERDQWRRLVFNLQPPPLPVARPVAVGATNR